MLRNQQTIAIRTNVVKMRTKIYKEKYLIYMEIIYIYNVHTILSKVLMITSVYVRTFCCVIFSLSNSNRNYDNALPILYNTDKLEPANLLKPTMIGQNILLKGTLGVLCHSSLASFIIA